MRTPHVTITPLAAIATLLIGSGLVGTAVSATAPPDDGPAVGEVGGSGCGIPHGPYDDPGEPSGEVRVAWNDPPLTFNNDTIHGNASAVSNVLYLTKFDGGFNYYDGELQFINNDQFGTCTVESLDPLTVTYEINDGVTWSDGVPVDAADMLLQWATQSTHLNDDQTVALEDATIVAEADDEGNAILVGPDGEDIVAADEEAYAAAFDDDGEFVEGYGYKLSAGVNFNGSSQSYQLITETPVLGDDGRSMTLTWDEFFVDYQLSAPSPGAPAHVVAGRALDIDDPMEAKQALIDAVVGNDREALKAIADFWNTGFDTDQLPDDEGLYLGYGAYNLVAYEQRAELIFEARDDYDWGPRPRVETIVYRIIGDPTAAVQALENEEVDIIQPQATSDILVQLEALADRGIEVDSGDLAVYEHVDLAVDNGGPFDPASYDGDEERARMVRDAFLRTIPRDEILERLIRPLNPDAVVRNSFTQIPGAPDYDLVAENNGMADYESADIDAAIELLEAAGAETPIEVRLIYGADNPRRSSQYELIRDSAARAGFEVLDGASADWVPQLQNTDLYDAALFGWQSTAVAVTQGQGSYVTDGANNYYGYSSEVVDGLFDELQGETDPERQIELLLQIEQELVNDAFGLTIFQHPDVLGYNATYVSGVDSIPLSPRFFHNFWEWEAS